MHFSTHFQEHNVRCQVFGPHECWTVFNTFPTNISQNIGSLLVNVRRCVVDDVFVRLGHVVYDIAAISCRKSLASLSDCISNVVLSSRANLDTWRFRENRKIPKTHENFRKLPKITRAWTFLIPQGPTNGWSGNVCHGYFLFSGIHAVFPRHLWSGRKCYGCLCSEQSVNLSAGLVQLPGGDSKVPGADDCDVGEAVPFGRICIGRLFTGHIQGGNCSLHDKKLLILIRSIRNYWDLKFKWSYLANFRLKS